MRSSFDAASMNDITREAGVSKGTLYVYFENKEDLFTALIARERNIIVNSVKQSLNGNEPDRRGASCFRREACDEHHVGLHDPRDAHGTRRDRPDAPAGAALLHGNAGERLHRPQGLFRPAGVCRHALDRRHGNSRKAVHRSRHGGNVQGPPFRHVRCRSRTKASKRTSDPPFAFSWPPTEKKTGTE